MSIDVAPATDFSDVTEMAGDPIAAEQLDRLYHRYAWAARQSAGRKVVEVACGNGPGLGMIHRVASSLEAGDYSETMLQRVRAHYGTRIPVRRLDAQAMPYADASKDVVILFEAIYYLPDVGRFIAECRRVLQPGGSVLLVTCNKDLYDFNPSPHSHEYLGIPELEQRFHAAGFTTECFGYSPVSAASIWQKLLRPVKKAAVSLDLIPKTMVGKRLLKALVFGPPVTMPAELDDSHGRYTEPTPLPRGVPDRVHKVIYCHARNH
jgi:SAM-dependent methyltransferase